MQLILHEKKKKRKRKYDENNSYEHLTFELHQLEEETHFLYTLPNTKFGVLQRKCHGSHEIRIDGSHIFTKKNNIATVG